MKSLFVILFAFGFIAQASNNEILCELESRDGLVTFMESIRGTTVSSSKIELLGQTQEDDILTSVFIIKNQGSLWSDEKVEVKADPNGRCLIEGIRMVE